MTSLPGKLPTMGTISDEKFPQFDVVSDFSDHRFAKDHPKLSPSAQKKIMKELKLLQDLPETIFVRVCETRVDLIRAAIKGVRCTPYYDGLFFFDIAFPSDYPLRPPKVHYHSFGYKINPFVFKNGEICISLLSTSEGEQFERWDPTQSTIFQVLLSIQALVLIYHSGWTRRTLRQKGRIPYNEELYLQNCKTMLQVLRRPPKNFEPLVVQHFKDRAMYILDACGAFREGSFVRVLHGRGDRRVVSIRCKEVMDQLYGDLALAMSDIGAPNIDYLVKEVMEERDEKAAAAATKKKEGLKLRGVWKSLIKKLKDKCINLIEEF